MKMVVAVVQSFLAERVVASLHGVPGVSGATFSEVSGFGRGQSRSAQAESDEQIVGTVPKMRVEVVARDDVVQAVVEAIRSAAHTGHRGDGKVFVVPVEVALRIATGETGEAVC